MPSETTSKIKGTKQNPNPKIIKITVSTSKHRTRSGCKDGDVEDSRTPLLLKIH